MAVKRGRITALQPFISSVCSVPLQHKMSAFAFSFSGDDIEDDHQPPPKSMAAETGTFRRAPGSAFPIAGQPLLAPQSHDLESMLEALPSTLAYSTLVVKLDDGSTVSIPRRELWDVKAQLMAEEDDEALGNLGKDDVRTGVYEGGFKSWESSVDVVKVLHDRIEEVLKFPTEVLELGCGTALPLMALFQWILQNPPAEGAHDIGMTLGLADYNPTVLQLVTLPNLILSWAQVKRHGSWELEGELEIDGTLLQEFQSSLRSYGIALSFFSGAWSPEFVRLVSQQIGFFPARLTVLGAETIYSPVALKSFAETLVALLKTIPAHEKTAIIAAKKVYFGVGGSMEDFCDALRMDGMDVRQIREESDGVRRAVVEVTAKLVFDKSIQLPDS